MSASSRSYANVLPRAVAEMIAAEGLGPAKNARVDAPFYGRFTYRRRQNADGYVVTFFHPATGESVPVALADTFVDASQSCRRLSHLYGPTDTERAAFDRAVLPKG